MAALYKINYTNASSSRTSTSFDEDVENVGYAEIRGRTPEKLEEVGEDSWELVLFTGPPPALRCSLWAPLIDKRDIHVLEWITDEVRDGKWNGRDVILKVAVSPIVDENFSDRTIGSLSITQDLDHTPKILGHLVQEGVVVGYVLEMIKGRSARLTVEDFESAGKVLRKCASTPRHRHDACPRLD
ncbi:hypothetical protein M422DRAFT_241250 [Sphaerobolus stellatus SS14]|nr:hypothetical protein M422DRAFT_241250 [Sphaerobolus stellatus SS14]